MSLIGGAQAERASALLGMGWSIEEGFCCKSIGNSEWALCEKADADGYYHLFAYSGDHGRTEEALTHLLVRPDSSIPWSSEQEVVNAMASWVEKLGAMSQLQPFLAPSARQVGFHLKVVHLPPNPIYRETMRLEQLVQGRFEALQAEPKQLDDLWYPEDLVNRGLKRSEKPVGRPHGAGLLHFEYRHSYEDRCYGLESATMHPTVRYCIEVTQGQIHSLEAKLNAIETQLEARRLEDRDPRPLEDLASMLRDQRSYLAKVLEKAKSYRKQHGEDALVHSNYYRDLLQEAEKEEIERIRGEEQKAQEAQKGKGKKVKVKKDRDFWRAVHERAAQKFVPFLVNCWQHTCQPIDGSHSLPLPGQEQAWMRFGAFYDQRCALFSMDEFMNPRGPIYKESLEQRGELLIKRLRENKIEKLPEVKPLAQGSGAVTNRVDPDEELSQRHQKIEGISGAMCEGAIDYALSRLTSQGGKLDTVKLRTWLAERRAIAEGAFLSLLQQQVRDLKPEQDELRWLHISLLKADGVKVEGSNRGWTHAEMYEARELRWAFEHFRGAKLCFADIVGPPKIDYDDQGVPIKITLSNRLLKKGALETAKELTLQSYCVNSSVASSFVWASGTGKRGKGRSNQLTQSLFNRPFFEQFKRKEEPLAPGGLAGEPKPAGSLPAQEEELFLDEPSIKDLRDTGESSFESAEELALWAGNRGWKISTCCQSGKDRTGYVCSRYAQRIVQEEISDPDLEHYRAIKAEFNKRPFEQERPSQQILVHNTGVVAPKVLNFGLTGKGGLPGHIWRLSKQTIGLGKVEEEAEILRSCRK